MTEPPYSGPAQSTAVAIIEPVGGYGGMDYYDLSLCRGLLNAGLRVSLYTCDETVDPEIQGLNFHPFYRGIYGQRSRWLQALRYIKATFASLRSAAASSVTVCHFHAFNDLKAELVLMTMAKLFGRKLVLTVHDVGSLAGHVTGKRMVTGWIYRLADRVIVHNNVSMRELIANGVPPQIITIIPHGHFLESMREMPPKETARRKLEIELSAKVVLFFGQIKDTKGLDLLIEALPAVADEVPEVLLLIAGRPWKTSFSPFDELIDKLNVRARCRLHIGFVPNDKVADFYAAADLMALPYRRIYQSGVLLMAMTYARPVVVSDLAGMVEIVSDGVNGYVFRQESKDDLAKVLIRALQDEAGGLLLSERALDYIREHHNWDKIGRSTAALYRDVLGS
jgi:glycosyltransferase involved in cell wall biosynthesis